MMPLKTLSGIAAGIVFLLTSSFSGAGASAQGVSSLPGDENPEVITGAYGWVLDADTGKPIPYAGVFFKGTADGTSSGSDGSFRIVTKNLQTDTLVCYLLGYQTVERRVPKNRDTEVTFFLELEKSELKSSFVKADNRKIRKLLAGIERNRKTNNPDSRPYYQCDVYDRMDLNLTHINERIRDKRFLQQLSFVFDHLDTSSAKGLSSLPVMMSESVSKRYHSSSPELDRETILANRISGVNKDNNLLAQFSGSLYLRANFYKPFINAFGIDFPSPAQKSGLSYYDYFIIDTLEIDSRKTYEVRYHPKKGSTSPAFDGEMLIDAGDFAIRSVHARMQRGANVNWLRNLALETEYSRVGDSLWFFSRDRMNADFSIVLTDSSGLVSFLGNRDITYSNPDFDAFEPVEASSAPVTVASDAGDKDEAYWDDARAYGLTEKERDIFGMVDEVQKLPLYKNAYKIVYALATGYLDFGPVGFGPVLKTISFNELEGFRPRIGIHTTKDLSTRDRWTGYLAYGTRDRELKGGLTYEHMFGREPTRKLTLDAHYDVFQLGTGQSEYTSGNILSSIWQGNRKLSPMSSFSASYEHEFSQSFNAQAWMHLKRHYSNGFVPMKDWAGNEMPGAASNEFGVKLRFSKDETVSRGYFVKTYLFSDYPVWTIALAGSVPGLRQGDCGFFRPELNFDYRIRIAPVGYSTVHLNAGTIIGKVPYPMLYIHAGNVTNLLDRTAFSCMDYFEFASDSWATLFYEHNFYGFFLNKVPFVNTLNLREVITLKAAWGALSDKNNGTSPEYGALMQFPEGMKPLHVPYVEVGAGLANILSLFRVECMWRLTHRDAARRNFVVSFGLDFNF